MKTLTVNQIKFNNKPATAIADALVFLCQNLGEVI
jgi:hypothetical protein